MFFPIRCFINTITNDSFDEILSRSFSDIQATISILTYLWVLPVDSECAADCGVSHGRRGRRAWRCLVLLGLHGHDLPISG